MQNKFNFSGENKESTPNTDYIREMNTLEEWEKIMESKEPVVFQCSASWCRPCQVLRPIMEKLVKNHEGKIIFYYVDIEKHP